MIYLLGLAFSFMGIGQVDPAKHSPLEVGMAEMDITPPLGYPMAGYYHERLATGKKDPLKAKAIVFRQGSTTGAIITCDLIGISADLSDAVRSKLSEKTQIPIGHIALTATHSHTAPDYSRDLYSWVTKTPFPDGKPRHAEAMVEKIVAAGMKANDALKPASLAAGSIQQKEPVSFHRRFLMRDGSVRTWQNLNNPEVVKSAGPIDPELVFAKITDAKSQKAIGLLSNFALHLDTVGGMEWSADYPFFIEQASRQALGESAVSLFGLGCCGNINHVNPFGKPVNKTPAIGKALAETLFQVPPVLEPQPEFRVHRKQVNLPLRQVLEGEVNRALSILDLVDAKGKVDFLDHVAAYKILIMNQFQNPKASSSTRLGWGRSQKWDGVGDNLPVEVQVFTIGRDLAIVCLPGEVFVEHGLAIKAGSPFRNTMIFELSNVVETVYIPNKGAFVQGGYEVVNSVTKPGSGELLVEAALELLRIPR